MVPLTFLLPENLLDLYDLFLDFAGYLFGFAFRLQLGIIGEFSGHSLDITLCFVKRAFPFALHAGFMVFLLSDMTLNFFAAKFFQLLEFSLLPFRSLSPLNNNNS